MVKKKEDTTAKNNQDVKNQKENMQEEIESISSIVYEQIKKELLETFSESDKRQQKEFIKNIGENIKYIKQLIGTPFLFISKGLYFIDEETSTNKKISEFLVAPIKKYDYISEEGIRSEIQLKVIIAPTGEELQTITQSIQDIESGKCFIHPSWWKKIKFEIPPQKNIQIACLKELCKDIEEETIYGFIGFTDIKGKKVFLHTGGAVGTDERVKVDLGDENLNRFILTDKNFDIKNTIVYTLLCLKVAPIRITLPIIALIYMTPLTSIFEELGIPIGFLTWVQGPQQCKKTSMVCALCSHFGFFDKNHTPMSFLDGIPSAREKSAKCRDSLIILDDYFPSSNKQEASNMRNFAEKIITSSSEKMTGTRSKSDGKMRKTYRMKGQVIATRRDVSRYKSKPYVKSIIYKCYKNRYKIKRVKSYSRPPRRTATCNEKIYRIYY